MSPRNCVVGETSSVKTYRPVAAQLRQTLLLFAHGCGTGVTVVVIVDASVTASPHRTSKRPSMPQH